MRRLLWLLLTATAVAQYNGNAPSVVQAYIDPAFGTVGSLIFPNSVTNGNMEFVCISVDRGIGGASGGPYTIASTRVPSWTQSSIQHLIGSGVRHNYDFVCAYGGITSSGTDTVTVTGNAGASVEFSGAEIANAIPTVDVSNSNLITTPQPASISTSLTTTIDGDFVIAGSMTSAGQGSCDFGYASTPSSLVTLNTGLTPYNAAQVIQANVPTTHGSVTLTRNNVACQVGGNIPGDSLAIQAYAFKPVASGVKVATTLLTDADTAHAYNVQLSAVGDSGSKTWTCCTAGSLPPSLSLSSAGVISGTSTGTVGQTYNFTVQVADGGDTATQALSISITPPTTSPIVSSVVSGTANLSAVLNAVEAGDAILVLAQGMDTHAVGGWIQGFGNAGLSDSAADVYLPTCPNSSGALAPMVGYIARAKTSGALTVTFNTTAGSNLTWFALDIPRGSYIVDCGAQSIVYIAGATTGTISTNITTPVANELVIAFSAGAMSGAPQPTDAFSAGFGIISTADFPIANSAHGAVATQLFNTAGTYSVSDTLTLSSAVNYQAGMFVIGIRPDNLTPTTSVGEKFRRWSW